MFLAFLWSEFGHVKFTVCVATVRPGTLVYTVRSILAQTWSDWELLIVGQGDDLSLQREGERAQGLDRRIRYIHIDQRGLSRARNVALRQATGDIVAMTDDDCEAAPDWLETLARLFERFPQVGVIGGALVAPRVSRWKLESCLSFMPAEELNDPPGGHPPSEGWHWIGANCALRKSVADRIGPFDECLGVGAPLFPAAEETDYGMRLNAAGIAGLTSPAPVVRHTYGIRRGIRQNVRTVLAYARGNGGLDGKLTLLGDPHGKESASRALRQGLRDAVRAGKIHRIPVALVYGLTYQRAYRQCVSEFAIGSDGCLTPIAARVELPSAV